MYPFSDITCPDARLRTIVALALVVGVVLTLAAGSRADDPPSPSTTFTFASDPTWNVFGADPGSAPGAPSLGAALKVCMNGFAPPNCPADAVRYAAGFSGWSADLAPIPGASWVWAPGVTGTTSPADLARFFFSKTFFLAGRVTSATIRVAVDDYAAVRVNGALVGSIGSIVSPDPHYNELTAFDIAPFLVSGANVVTVEAQNGPSSFAGCGPCSYAGNPAGVVFGGSITVAPPRPCLRSTATGPLTVSAGQSVCIATGGVQVGPVTVETGGALEVEGGTIVGTLRATGAASVRLCGATATGIVSISGSKGLVLVGGDAATGPCAGNRITGPVTLTGNTAGVEFTGNVVTGRVTITGNTGTLPPPNAGPVHATGNTIVGPSSIQS